MLKYTFPKNIQTHKKLRVKKKIKTPIKKKKIFLIFLKDFYFAKISHKNRSRDLKSVYINILMIIVNTPGKNNEFYLSSFDNN